MAPTSSTPFEYHSATDWLERLRTRQISAVELLQMQLQRVAQYNPSLNLVVAQDAEAAFAQARAADNVRNPTGALHGLSMTIKDTWEVTGMPATCGFPFLAKHIPASDADTVARLKAAGAIVFGKTNVPLAASDHQSYNPLYGCSNNPWNPAHTVGGSSGGAAGALAAGFTSLELGSDIGGSIRCPAHFCGVFGHKPSYGIIPLRGHIPGMPGTLSPVELVVAGPMARSAADLELAMDLLTMPSGLDGTAWRVSLPPTRHTKLSDFRVALWLDAPGFGLDNSYRDALLKLGEDLRKEGVTVLDGASAVAHEIDARASHALYIEMLFAIIAGGLDPSDIERLRDAGIGADETSYEARMARAVTLPHRDFYHLLEQQAQMMRAWQRVFQGVDIVLSPVLSTAAYKHDHSHDALGAASQQHRRVVVNGEERPYLDGLQWPGLATFAQLPSTAIPLASRVNGLPVGVQAMGPYLEDRTTLQFARLVEQALGGFQAPF
nr:amidase [uncultured Rhodoferax sp.]